MSAPVASVSVQVTDDGVTGLPFSSRNATSTPNALLEIAYRPPAEERTIGILGLQSEGHRRPQNRKPLVYLQSLHDIGDEVIVRAHPRGERGLEAWRHAGAEKEIGTCAC